MRIVVPDAVYNFIEEQTMGISDEMTLSQINTANEAYEILQTIRKESDEDLKSIPNTKEQNIAFRKAWDAKFERSQRAKDPHD